ncbi:MAG: T9SS type A sorting domain-containing protein [bacterium]|nr:T9SS type A sorting domain-containing protein [bacterium]
MTKSLVLYLMVGLCTLQMTAQAQIPNPGFEEWTDSHSPVGWYTNNVETESWITISQTGGFDSHSGFYAIRGDVIWAGAVPYPPSVWTGSFPCSQPYAELTGWYEFSSVNGDILSVSILIYGHDGALGNALFIDHSALEFHEFSVPINYSETGDPDSAAIAIEILRQDAADVNVGSFFIVDDLAFRGVSSVPEELATQTVPTTISLHENYPNPFNATTTLAYDLPRAGHISLRVFDLLGREVAVLKDGVVEAGTHHVMFDGNSLGSGIYFARLDVGRFSQTQKLMLIK